MQPEAWRRRIGNDNWHYIVGDGDPTAAAEMMTRLYEAGWRGPEVEPKIDPKGLKVLWPATEQHGVGALTAEGLVAHYQLMGHRFYLLRMEQAVRAMGGPLTPRFQELLAAYELQCKADGVEPLPEFADWDVFVGGEGPTVDPETLAKKLAGE